MEFMHSPLLAPGNALYEKEAVLDVQWSRLAEAIRREATKNSEMGEILLDLVQEPVEENLALRFIESASQHSELVARVAEGSEELLAFLRRPVHPELTGGSILGQMAKYMPNEVMEASRRLRFARDLKILSAGMALGLAPERQEALGIHVELTEHAAEYPSLLQPEEWKSRSEIQDRVYLAEVGEDKLIFKEKKSPQHIRQHEHIKEPTNTSAEEVRIAQELREQTTFEGSDIELSYEIPVAAVTYGDGYQFALFKFEEGLMGDDEARAQVMAIILENFDSYAADYHTALELIREYVSEHGRPRVLNKVLLSLGKEALPAWKRFLGIQPREITQETEEQQDLAIPLEKEQFASVFAEALIGEGGSHLKAVTRQLGYSTQDGDQRLYRVRLSPESRAVVEVVGFDFEFHRRVGEQKGPYDNDAYARTHQDFNKPRLPKRDYPAQEKDIPRMVAYYAVKEARRLSLGL